MALGEAIPFELGR